MSLTYNTSIVRDGLVLLLDAANPKSYPGTGTVWKDISGNGNDAVAVNLPTYVSDGPSSHWVFDAVDDEFHSVDVSRDYRDIIIVMESTATTSELDMVFGVHNDQDKSLRLGGVSGLRDDGNIDSNDWQYQNTSDVFINGQFDALSSSSYDLRNKFNFVRSYRTNNTFPSTFRYEISSSFYNRRFEGKIALIMCYDRRLSDDEVQQNFNAFRGRYGL